MLVNVAEAVRAGQAHVESPSDAALGPNRFVDVRYLTVADVDPDRGTAGASRREWLYMHPPSQISVDVVLPPRRQIWFRAGLALDPAMWQAPAGDGVRFQVLVSRPVTTGRREPPAVALDRAINLYARCRAMRPATTGPAGEAPSLQCAISPAPDYQQRTNDAGRMCLRSSTLDEAVMGSVGAGRRALRIARGETGRAEAGVILAGFDCRAEIPARGATG